MPIRFSLTVNWVNRSNFNSNGATGWPTNSLHRLGRLVRWFSYIAPTKLPIELNSPPKPAIIFYYPTSTSLVSIYPPPILKLPWPIKANHSMRFLNGSLHNGLRWSFIHSAPRNNDIQVLPQRLRFVTLSGALPMSPLAYSFSPLIVPTSWCFLSLLFLSCSPPFWSYCLLYQVEAFRMPTICST